MKRQIPNNYLSNSGAGLRCRSASGTGQPEWAQPQVLTQLDRICDLGPKLVPWRCEELQGGLRRRRH
eukprot:1569367-Rhodomonas_salina.9